LTTAQDLSSELVQEPLSGYTIREPGDTTALADLAMDLLHGQAEPGLASGGVLLGLGLADPTSTGGRRCTGFGHVASSLERRAVPGINPHGRVVLVTDNVRGIVPFGASRRIR
jgi:hypothetical protein